MRRFHTTNKEVNMKDLAKKLKIDLTEKQEKYADAIYWLISDQNIAEGRTTLLALALIKKAIDNPGETIRVFDHANNTYHSENIMINYISFLAKKNKKIKNRLKINLANYTIEYKK